MRVEVWSDVVCPWCYIGKRRFEAALAVLAADGDDIEVEVVYRPFQLDPQAPPGTTTPVIDAYARKFGGYEQAQAMIDRVTDTAANEGLEFHLDRAQRANTLLAHRLLWWAEQPSSPLHQAALKERLLTAYFTRGENVGNPDLLADIGTELGADHDTVMAFLESDEGSDEVQTLLREAQADGITAVPTYVVDGAWAIPGAQDPTVFVAVLRKLAHRARAS
jgi:predicted DsbA family dithiol-disulfide isomerase